MTGQKNSLARIKKEIYNRNFLPKKEPTKRCSEKARKYSDL